MKISKQSWTRYIAALRMISDKAADSMRHYFETYGSPKTLEDVENLIYVAWNISNRYGEAAATLAAEMYDATALMSGMNLNPAIPAETATYGEVAKAVRGTLKTENQEIVSGSVSRLVKMTGVDTVMHNALRDGAQWAWIPSGDTCAFCITLASRGWQNASRKAIRKGHAEHIHANCDCTYAVRFDNLTQVEGYDPDEYKAEYDEAKAQDPADPINYLRREFYDENKDVINAQKRDNYEKRKERESSAAEEQNV